jgi:hypothetical protein
VSLDRKRWAVLAQQLKFGQLDIARAQAEVWRNGLASLTALLTAILVLKGRDNVSALTEPYQAIVISLLGLSLLLLIGATMWVSRALAGPPGQEILLSGESLRDWTNGEVKKISTAVETVPWLAAVGVILVAVAVGITWIAPTQDAGTSPLVTVSDRTGGQLCGQLVGIARNQVILGNGTIISAPNATPSPGPTVLPLTEVTAITPVSSCP